MLHGLILYPRATCSTVGPGVPTFGPKRPVAATYGHVVVSLHRGASTYAYGQFPWYTARKPTIGDSLLTLLSHMPTIRESAPSDHRTKRCRRGSEPIVYGSRPCNFCRGGQSCRVGGVSFSKGSDPGSILFKVLRDFLPIHLNSPKNFTTKMSPLDA